MGIEAAVVDEVQEMVWLGASQGLRHGSRFITTEARWRIRLGGRRYAGLCGRGGLGDGDGTGRGRGTSAFIDGSCLVRLPWLFSYPYEKTPPAAAGGVRIAQEFWPEMISLPASARRRVVASCP